MKPTILFLLTLTLALTASAAESTPLFNGKDLTGWFGADYEVKDGILIVTGKNLITKKQYTNYVFEFEFLLPPGGNNGIGIHYPGEGGPSKSGIEIQILDNHHPKYANLLDSQYHGSLYKLQAAKRGALKPTGEWNRQKITVDGPRVIVELNGIVINDANLDELAAANPKAKNVQRRSGHLALCGHGNGVQFRNITILELPDTDAKPTPSPENGIYPDRESFAKGDHEFGQVPLSALQLDESARNELKIEVWAESPLIFTPVAMDVDARGRIWCTEGLDYSVNKRIEAGQSIIVLEDSNLDGKADSSHVFVTEPDIRHAPLGIAVFDNQIVLSATPDIIVYTDVDRDAVFNPEIDKREVFLTGFAGGKHDHTLHAVVGSPSGQWYFSFGNMGCDVETIDGQHFYSGCYYGNSELIGKRSSDGHLYIGGTAMRINRDGTGLTAVAHNMRNPHDMFVSSLGDVYQSDNDDPAHCRSTWLMEHGNLGYADLQDGARSWEEAAKSWEEPADFNMKQRFSASHWRENYPGTQPPGTVYGAGSPTGNVFIEGDELGESFRGLYLHCDMVRKEVMGYTPKPEGAHVEMGPHHPFIGLKEESKGEFLFPTDLVLGLDGALYLSDFYNETSRRTHQVSGTIYRISRKDETPVFPVIDFDSEAGLITALQSPTIGVRTEAVHRLKSLGDDTAPALIALFESATNPYHQARALWVLAQTGPEGRAFAEGQLESSDETQRLVAWRALRFADSGDLLTRAAHFAQDKSPALRREVAVSLRDAAFEDCQAILTALIAGYDGESRFYLEALGIAATGKEQEVYSQVIRPELTKAPFGQWDTRAKNLAWRLHTPEAIEDLQSVILAQSPGLEEFRHLAMAYAVYANNDERTTRMKRLTELGEHPAFTALEFQITVEEIIAKDLNKIEGELLETSYIIPAAFGADTEISNVETIAKLSADFDRGQASAQLCKMCHKIQGEGVPFGPDLSQWGGIRTIEQIVTDIIEPSAHLAHGYDKPVRLTAGDHVAEGLLSNYSFHSGSLKLKLFGGETKKILFRKSGAKIDYLDDHSWMPPASKMGLNDQDVRNIAEYLKQIGSQ
mgnify:CR=1 FL=1